MKISNIKTAAAAQAPATLPMHDRFLRLAQVMEIAGLGRTMIYRLIRKGAFPKPLKPGGESSRWVESEVRAWQEARKAERDAA